MKNRHLLLPLIMLCCFGSLSAGTYSGGSGTFDDPYQIATAADLIELSNTSPDWSRYFIQTADVLFNEDSSLVDWDGDGTVWDADDESGFSPIGNAFSFTGTYHGQGHVIDHLFIDLTSSSYTGLFGYTTHATIDHLGITNANIHGAYNVAALVGYPDDNSSIDSCYATGHITASEHSVGGIAGYAEDNSIITNCFNECNIESDDLDIAGIVGQSYKATIDKCYNTGNIYAVKGTVGGIGGYLHTTTVTNCYSTGNISAALNSSRTGGLIGRFNSSTLENSYSTGSVSGDLAVGGLIGYSTYCTVTNSFWDIETSGMATSYDNEIGKTTEEMKTLTTFTGAGWDFVGESANGSEEIWDMDGTTNDGYPYLTSMPTSDTPLPISLISFSAKAVDGNVNISWYTASETNNAQFLIYRNNKVIVTVDGAGTSSEPHNYSIVDNAVVPGVAYTYVLADLSYANELVKHEDRAVTVILDNDIAETDYVIGAAYPNPFNPSAVLPLELNSDATVKASLYDLNGREIKGLVNGKFSAGTHELHIDGSDMTTGIYMVRVVVNDVLNVQKIALVK